MPPEPTDTLVLDPSPPAGGEGTAARRATQATYKHPLAHYEAVYGAKPNKGRTIKRWVKTGRERQPVPDLPPLDDPPAMAAWWSRNMTWTVPAKLLTLAQAAPTQASGSLEPSGEVGKGAGSETQRGADGDAGESAEKRKPLDLPQGSGFAAALDRANTAERTAYAAWQKELAAEVINEGNEEMRRRAWERAVEIVRKLEKDAEGILGRDLIAWPEAEQQVQEHLNTMNRAIRSLIVRVATKIGLPQDWFRRVDEAYQSELDRAFDDLASGDYEGESEGRFQLAA